MSTKSPATAIKQTQHELFWFHMQQKFAVTMRNADETVTCRVRKALVARPYDGLLQSIVQTLIRIQAQYPVVAGLLDAKIFLIAVAGKFTLDDAGTCGLGNGYGLVRGKGINDDDFIAEIQ